MEIVRREKAPDDFRVRQLRARDMLRGDLEGEDLDAYVQERILTTTLDKAVLWARGNSIFPLSFGLFAMTETIVFVVLLMIAFVYVWRRGALAWK